MVFDCARADFEDLTNFCARFSFGGETQDLALPQG
jgi:hypothetical protein